MKTIAVPLAAICLLAVAACGSEAQPAASPTPSASTDVHGVSATAGSLSLTDFWVKQSSLDMSAAFGEIHNNGASADALVSVTATGVPAVELHQTTNDVMQQVDQFDIPAGEDLDLAPGGNHIMLIGLTAPLVPGDNVDLTLTFASGATAAVTSPVVSFTGDDGHDHDH